ncbi:MAG: hypothetical protein ACQEQC_08255 [Elusimicrobiota bacterium]
MKKFLVILTLLFLPAEVFASSPGKIGVGINYPGISLKYFCTENISIEPKFQFGDNIFTGGIRGNYHFSGGLYGGIEGDYISFKGKISEGAGLATAAYGGIEMGNTEGLTFQFDIGPVFIILSDKNYDVSENYLEFMGNIGINYYFK